MVVHVGSASDAVTVSVLGRTLVTVWVLGVIVVADVDIDVVVVGEVTVAVVVLGSVIDEGTGSVLVAMVVDVVVSEGMVTVVVVLLVSLSNAGAVLAKHSKHDTWPSPMRQSKHRPSVGVVNGLRVVNGLMDSAKPVLITIRASCTAADGPRFLVVCVVVVEVPRTSCCAADSLRGSEGAVVIPQGAGPRAWPWFGPCSGLCAVPLASLLNPSGSLMMLLVVYV